MPGIDLLTRIMKNLANAPTIAAQKTLDELTNENDIKLAMNYFESVGIKVEKPVGTVDEKKD